MADRRSRISRWAEQRRSDEWSASDPTAYDPRRIQRTVASASRWIGPDRYLDSIATGWEHVPDEPCMLVANHSGGTTVPDVWSLLTAWYTQFGAGRPLYTLGHELLFATDLTTRFFVHRGVLRASYKTAEQVLDAGGDLLVFPGGERDVWRPWYRRWRVDFAGRTGYAKLALTHQLPIVPVAGAGAHHTLLVLADGHRIARWLRLNKAARAEVMPIHLSFPWGLAIGPWPHVPVPHRIRFRVGRPVPPKGSPDSEVDVYALDARVRQSLQHELLAIKARWPDSRRSVRQMVRHMLRNPHRR